MTYLVKGIIKGSGGRGKEKLEIRNVNVRSITLTENGCTSPEDRVLSGRRGDLLEPDRRRLLHRGRKTPPQPTMKIPQHARTEQALSFPLRHPADLPLSPATE